MDLYMEKGWEMLLPIVIQYKLCAGVLIHNAVTYIDK